jgi:pilus assembly protein CpaC
MNAPQYRESVWIPGPLKVALAVALVLAASLLFPTMVDGQRVQSSPDRVVTVARGASALLTLPTSMARMSIADESIADAVLVSPTEILINAKLVGLTSLVVWDEQGQASLFNIEVTTDVAALERQLNDLFPGNDLELSMGLGGSVVVSGEVRDPSVVSRTLQIAQAAGLTVIDNISAPSAKQILLHVRFAEVNRSVLEEWGSTLFAQNPNYFGGMFKSSENLEIGTVSEGLVSVLVSGNGAELSAVIRALKTTGDFNSLAEPNLITMEGQEATFLAGGEFPFPVVQSGASSNAISIQWKEFGVRLNFTPTITNSGNVRLKVAPEVSALDFTNGLVIGGYEIPSILTRRVSSDVELAPGQHLAIAGLLDNSILESVNKIPILGDIPILGYLFKSTDYRERRSELLVIVTPHIVEPLNTAPALPTGEPDEWDWDNRLKDRANPGAMNPFGLPGVQQAPPETSPPTAAGNGS